MEQKLSRIPVLIVTAVLSVIAYFLRSHQLKTAFDEVGVVPGAVTVILSVFCIAAVVLFAVYAWFLRSRKKYGSVSSREVPLLAVSLAAAVCLLLSSVMLAMAPAQKGDMLVAVGGAVTAVCWTAVAMARFQGKKAHAALFLLPAVFYVVDLICQFRFWTRDPVILDYCFDLFALICTMCAVFHLGGYCFDKGSRRATAFFSFGGVFFSVISMAGAAGFRVLGYLGAVLWLLGNLWLLLRPGRKMDNGQ